MLRFSRGDRRNRFQEQCRAISFGTGQCATMILFRNPVHPLCTFLDLDVFPSEARSSALLTEQDLLRGGERSNDM